MITKKLLSAVLKREIITVEFISHNLLHYMYVNPDSDSAHSFNHVNIYELSHKCKEWAYTKEYIYEGHGRPFQLMSGKNPLRGWFCYNDGQSYTFDSVITNSTSEPEAIFKACQWILENK